ncbi:tRNA methyltransferase 10 homolog A [Orussus abietinus]|uniref:tRNA methyltransferase 10 homolog A n=1 Tax=Orussus abietinus TaxID=222816 RepID=UPI000625B5A5|nr:tRNA methyltransferase 10 homolog A [Orussus abietinus]
MNDVLAVNPMETIQPIEGVNESDHNRERCNEDLISSEGKIMDVVCSEKKVMDNVEYNLKNPEIVLSKRHLKKLKKLKMWNERKDLKRLKERAKRKKKLKEERETNKGFSRIALKNRTMAASLCKLTVTIDLSFDELMIGKDLAKLTKQILRCYSLNRRSDAPIQFSITNFNGPSLLEMEKHNGYENWDVKFCKEPYLKVYPKDKIVYLTSESENVIEELDHDSVYVIGGLVDHNSRKGLCYNEAVKVGIRHGQLPLNKFLKMNTRKVLTIDHVFEILLRVSEGKTWQEAFIEVLPERKNAQLILPKKMDNLHELEIIHKNANEKDQNPVKTEVKNLEVVQQDTKEKGGQNSKITEVIMENGGIINDSNC